jgi:hypothetical protein
MSLSVYDGINQTTPDFGMSQKMTTPNTLICKCSTYALAHALEVMSPDAFPREQDYAAFFSKNFKEDRCSQGL